MYKTDNLPVTIYFYPLLSDIQAKKDEIEKYMSEMHVMEKNESVLYVHIPYCISHCLFCPFNTKVVTLGDNIQHYIDALVREAEMVAPLVKGIEFKSIYYGGGSPSIISGNTFINLHNSLKRIFGIPDNVEISVEGELRTLHSKERLEAYKSVGVQRLSFGLQTFDNSLRKRFNIPYCAETAITMINSIAEYEFKELNADMMYGLPNHTLKELRYDISCLQNVNIGSVDYYRFHPYSLPNSQKGDWIHKADSFKPQFVENIIDGLNKQGFHNVCDQIYSKVGMSEYARLLWGNSDDETNAYMVGIGASARGFLNGHSYMNVATVEEYEERLSAGLFPIDQISDICPDEERRGVFSPKYFYIPSDFISILDSNSKERLSEWENYKWIERKEQGYGITDDGKVHIDEMIIELMPQKQYTIATGIEKKISGIENLRTGRF